MHPNHHSLLHAVHAVVSAKHKLNQELYMLCVSTEQLAMAAGQGVAGGAVCCSSSAAGSPVGSAGDVVELGRWESGQQQHLQHFMLWHQPPCGDNTPWCLPGIPSLQM